MVRKGGDKEDDHVESAVVSCLQYAAYAVEGKNTVEGMVVVGRETVDVGAGS